VGSSDVVVRPEGTRQEGQRLFSSTAQRRKVRNLAREPRISVSVYEAENPYNSVDIRGSAELFLGVGRGRQLV
jgi:hypothetical protein